MKVWSKQSMYEKFAFLVMGLACGLAIESRIIRQKYSLVLERLSSASKTCSFDENLQHLKTVSHF